MKKDWSKKALEREIQKREWTNDGYKSLVVRKEKLVSRSTSTRQDRRLSTRKLG